jgi:hypothetical protein
MSRDYLAGYVEREVNREKLARDNVLGITFVGESQTTGSSRLVLHPSEHTALAEVVFEGNIQSRTMGRKGPATLHYLAHSNVSAKKQIVIGERGLQTRPATARAPTLLTLVDVDTSLPRLRGRIATRIAWRRAEASRPRANAIVSDHREHDMRTTLDQRLNKRVAEIQAQVATQLAALKLSDKNETTMMRSRSTSQYVEVALYRSEADIRRSPIPRFEVLGNPDLAVRVHHSILARVVADAESRTHFAPLLARVLQSGLALGDQVDGEVGSKILRGLGSEWLELDITDADYLMTGTRVAVEESSNGPLR